MKKIYYTLLAPLIFLLPINSHGQTTQISVCSNIIDQFNTAELANIYNPNAQIKLTAGYHFIRDALGHDRPTGCTIHAQIELPSESNLQDLGTAIIYQQSDSQAMYENSKQNYAAPNATFNWGNLLPFVQNGFIDTSDSNFQTFDGYLTNGDYVIFIYKGIQGINGSSPTHLDQNFASFINVMSQQIVNN